MRRSPTGAQGEMLQHRRPDGAPDIVAGCGNGDRKAAATVEPLRDVSHQRPERGRCAEPDERIDAGKEREIECESRGNEARRERDRAACRRHQQPETV